MSQKAGRLYLNIAVGIAAVGVVLGFVYFSFKVANHVIDAFDPSLKKEKLDYRGLKENFFIGFDNPGDAKFFDAHESAFEITDAFAVQGKHSLKVEFPSGREFPGIGLEVFGRDCFDWSGMSELSFVVHNTIAIPGQMTVKIKSGVQYPKEVFETSQDLPAESTVRFKIKRNELEGAELDLKRISGITFYVRDPRTSFIVYLDDIRVTKGK
jgi:hypothetical protein